MNGKITQKQIVVAWMRTYELYRLSKPIASWRERISPIERRRLAETFARSAKIVAACDQTWVGWVVSSTEVMLRETEVDRRLHRAWATGTLHPERLWD